VTGLIWVLCLWMLVSHVLVKRKPRWAWRAVRWFQHRVNRRRYRKAYAYPGRRLNRRMRLVTWLPVYGVYAGLSVGHFVAGQAWSWRAWYDLLAACLFARVAWGTGPGLRLRTWLRLRSERRGSWRGY
jgi:hypothetical protein